MRLLKVFSYILLLSSLTFAQVITSYPTFPTENDSIRLVFDVSKASNTALAGYTGTVYIHSGVYTSSSPNSWSHVIGSWGNNNTQPKLTRIGTDLYELIIDNSRNYYSVTNLNEQITQLNFVLRSSDGGKQTEDLFQKLYDGNIPNLKIVTPNNDNTVVNEGNQLNIFAISQNVDSLSLYVDNKFIKTISTDTLKYSFIPTTSGSFQIIGKSTLGELSETRSYFVLKNAIIEDLPSGIDAGINYTSPTSVTLALFAPMKKSVILLGDFNNWELTNEFRMKVTPDSSYWWISLSNLTPKMEYAFQYLIDGKIRLADPYADKVLDPWNDKYISNSTYPNLMKYPEGKTSEIVSVFQPDQDSYNWTANDYVAPSKENLIIYELLMRDFTDAHDFKTLIDTLSYFESLGINAIELMPVNEFEGNLSWGYNPSFYFAPDKYYGPKNDFKRFVDECHKRNIAVIMDIVLNHSEGQSPFVRLYADGNYGPPSSDNLWYNTTCPHEPYCYGHDFNHESIYTQQLVDRINNYWISEYNIDGYRFDFTKGFTNNSNADAYDKTRINIIKRMGDALWSNHPNAYMILEHWGNNNEEMELANYGFLLWGNIVSKYNEGTMGYNENGKSDLSWGIYSKRGWSVPNLVTYLESHDEERLMFKNEQYGNSNGDYNIKDLNVGLQRNKLAASFFFTIPGPKMFWEFGELGYDYSINRCTDGSIDEKCRTSSKPIRWDYQTQITRNNLYKTFSSLINLKKNYPVFSTNDFSASVTGKIKTIKLNHSTMNVVIIGNFDVLPHDVNPSFQNTGWWYDYFSGDSLNVSDANNTFNLEEGGFRIYSSVKLPKPEDDIAVSLDDNINKEMIVDYKLSQNYPNPFNPTTTIAYQIPEQGLVSIKVYDILGKEVAELVNEVKTIGNHKVVFDASNLSSGIYFYTLRVNDFINSNKMVILK